MTVAGSIDSGGDGRRGYVVMLVVVVVVMTEVW